MTVEVSHGRGGAGNFNPDDTKYVDGEVVRAGVEGSHGDGAYSAGRGGAGNIGDVGVVSAIRKDHDIVPDAAVRASVDNQAYHTGRGGSGNEHAPNGHDKTGHANGDEKKAAVETAPVGLADKLKNKLFGTFKN